jgi:hypothetical protein
MDEEEGIPNNRIHTYKMTRAIARPILREIEAFCEAT